MSDSRTFTREELELALADAFHAGYDWGRTQDRGLAIQGDKLSWARFKSFDWMRVTEKTRGAA